MSETRTITMKTNFEGLIRLLADGLYSTSDIFVRELIQNGHDSIVRREALKESFYQGEISITYDSSEKALLLRITELEWTNLILKTSYLLLVLQVLVSPKGN